MVIGFDRGLKLDDCVLYTLGTSNDADFLSKEKSGFRCYKFVIVTCGDVKLDSGSSHINLKKGDIYIAFPFDSFRAEYSNDFECRYICFNVSSNRYGNAFNKIWSGNMAIEKRVFESTGAFQAVSLIFKEFENKPDVFSKELVSLFCSQMLVYIMRAFEENESCAEIEGTFSNVGLCGLVTNYIDTHLYEMKSLADMASKLGYNYSYLSTTFHKTTNTTLNSYYKAKRMEAAKNLLSDSKMTVSKIAELMNYSSVYAFSKAFKEHFGISPGHYSGRYENKNV